MNALDALATSPDRATLNPDDRSAWIDEVLAEHLASQAHLEQLGRLKLSPRLKGLMWALRLYVLFMATVVVVNVFQQLH